MNIFNNIRSIRLQKNLKLAFVAKMCQMSVTGYGNIERGNVKNLTINRLVNIANALDVSVLEIFLFDQLEGILLNGKKLEIILESQKISLNQKDNEIHNLKELIIELKSLSN